MGTPNGDRAQHDFPEGPFREARFGWLVLGIVWAASVAYLVLQLRHGWAPFDAGQFGEMADRVLRGQVPGRDFGEVYTGGLTYLDALAFRLFGVSFFSVRIPLFLFFVGWVPAVYFIARRFAGPIGAGMVTLLSVAWSVPNYPEAMPSWYNLFFATWGVLAFFRYMEDERRRWLWIAGLCGGLSFLAKISGLYFVAAGLLFLVFREQSVSGKDKEQSEPGAIAYRLFASVSLLLFLTVLVTLVSRRPRFANYLHFFLPSAVLVTFLLWRTWRRATDVTPGRFSRLFSMVIPFLAGALAPVAVFLLWYAHEGAVTDWFRNTFVHSTAHLLWVASTTAPLVVAVSLVPMAFLLFLAGHRTPDVRRVARYGAALILAALLVLAWKIPVTRLFIGTSLPLLIPAVAIGLVLVLRRPMIGSNLWRQRIFLLVAAAVCCALVQFPSPAAIYFNYVAPLVILALSPLLTCWPRFDRVTLGSLLVFYLVFAVWLRTPGYFMETREVPGSHVAFKRLNLPRAGDLLVKASEAEEYETLVHVIQAHARGRYIYCTPDCPEVYFLSGKRNPTMTIFEFMDNDFPDLAVNTAGILDDLRDHRVAVAVLSSGPLIESGPIPAGLRAALDAQFPDSQRVGDFEVRWKH